MAIQTVGIIGAGTMGNGIAQACAVSGIDVVMVDISEAAVQKGDVHENPWRAVAISAGLGLLVGLVIGRSK